MLINEANCNNVGFWTQNGGGAGGGGGLCPQLGTDT